MTKKIFRHKWIEQDGFRVHRCTHCGIERYWDGGFGRLMFRWGKLPNGEWLHTGYIAPACKRIMHCDKIET